MKNFFGKTESKFNLTKMTLPEPEEYRDAINEKKRISHIFV
tara:strand:+ start:235 stop:357 length:123 start_codon:yes stop_codon:yes gene_type:complete